MIKCQILHRLKKLSCTEKNDDYVFIISGIVLSIILGWLSYTYIENPTRKKLSNLSKVKAYLLWISAISILSTISIFIFKLDGVKDRFSTKIQNITNVTYDLNPRRKECHGELNGVEIKSCIYGKGPTNLIVLGDSHADGMLNSVIHALPLNTSLIAFTIDGCQNVLGLKKTNASNYYCGLRVQKILNIIHQDYKDIPILVINRSNTVFNGVLGDTKPEKYVQNIYESFSRKYQHEMRTAYLATYKELSKQNPVFVTTPTPEAHAHIPTATAKFELYGLSENLLKIPVSEYFSRSEASLETQNIAHQKYGVNIIDLSKEFCDENFCYFTQNGIPIFYDDDHMSWQASLMLTPLFKKEIFGKK